MKRLLTISALAVVLLACGSLFAQLPVTKFLGIPVDGTKSAMIQKLKAKGFTHNIKEDCLEGEFNGTDVDVYIGTNNNKVWRIVLVDKNKTRDIEQIRRRFNTLCSQFSSNGKYSSFSADQSIPEDEDIRYEMSVNNKQYEASFYQTPKDIDTTTLTKYAQEELLSKYTQEQLDNPTEEVLSDIKTWILKTSFVLAFNNSVWFKIEEQYGRYFIMMFYDNERNKANGEDL